MIAILSDRMIFTLYSTIMLIIGMVIGYWMCRKDQEAIREKVFKKK